MFDAGSDLTLTLTNAQLSTGNWLSSQGCGKTRMNMQIKAQQEKRIIVLILSSRQNTNNRNEFSVLGILTDTKQIQIYFKNKSAKSKINRISRSLVIILQNH